MLTVQRPPLQSRTRYRPADRPASNVGIHLITSFQTPSICCLQRCNIIKRILLPAQCHDAVPTSGTDGATANKEAALKSMLHIHTKKPTGRCAPAASAPSSFSRKQVSEKGRVLTCSCSKPS